MLNLQVPITITTNEQGSSVVSARELYDFLEVKTKFPDWCKRMFEYGFEPSKDYIEVYPKNEINLGGRPSVDYVLAINTAKEISMLQRTDKGKAARQYFIECERIVKEAVKPKTQLEILLESVQILSQQESRLASLESKLNEIEQSRATATQALLLAERSTEQMPEETLRMKIRKLVNQYCYAKNIDYRSVWNVVYDRLYYRYGVNLKAVLKHKDETTLEAAERLGHLDKIFVICSSELVY
jgi:anti-repressor protein